ncbi:hypothetical protein [Neotabrizicola sp. VNH66]|uniref:hypothetical protein n=1 Tax=Neotabrizicola sp. VNH66 TaxID=3400918 RepID=UPI003C09AC0C
MSRDEKMIRLTRMADLLFEARSAELRRAAEARDAVRAQISALLRPVAEEDRQNPAMMRQAMIYESWASVRRSELNAQLARRQAEWLQGMEAARRAFGRNQVLARLADPARKIPGRD